MKMSTVAWIKKLKMINIYIECGPTLNSSIHSGIQRTVFSIISSLKKHNKKNVKIFQVEFTPNGFFFINTNNKYRQTYSRPINRIKKYISDFYPSLAEFIKPLYHFSLNFFSVPKFFLPSYSRNFKKKLIIESGSNDQHILLLLDANWNNGMWKHIQNLKQDGCYVTAVLYDLIVFKHPEFFQKRTRESFKKWWLKAPNHLDSVLCISKCVREDFINFQKNNATKFKCLIDSSKVSHFKLGANFLKDNALIKALSFELPFFIMVGSIEPRKNHNFVIDAFEELWRKKYNVGLIIVGNNSWHSEVIIKRIKNHREFNNKLFLTIRDVSDRELFFLYRASKGLIMASKDEGFGLPIVEAMELNVKVLCSDIPVLEKSVVITHFSLIFITPLN